MTTNYLGSSLEAQQVAPRRLNPLESCIVRHVALVNGASPADIDRIIGEVVAVAGPSDFSSSDATVVRQALAEDPEATFEWLVDCVRDERAEAEAADRERDSHGERCAAADWDDYEARAGR